MRHTFFALAVLVLPAVLLAQPPQQEKPKFLAKIEQVRVGFRTYNANDGIGQFKVGMWTPVYVDVKAGLKGVPVRDPAAPPFLEFESSDSEGVGTFYRVPVALEPEEGRTFLGYTKPGNLDTASKVGVTLRWDDKTFTSPPQMGTPLLDL